MHNILTLNNIAPVGLNQFPKKTYKIGTKQPNPDAILVRSSDMHSMIIPFSVKVIGRAGAGVNNIPVAAMTNNGIPVMNTPGANANAVKELVLAGMLLASRNICSAWNYVNQLSGDNENLSQQIEKNKKQFVGFELQNKTVGIIGLGNVGVKVANAALALGMHVMGYDPNITVNNALALSEYVRQAENLETLLKQADFISIHIPLGINTKHFINNSRLKLLKPHAVLLNFSREEVVDSTALLEHLEENTLHAYVTDFPIELTRNHPRIICLPHLGASTKEAEENCAVMVAQQVRDFLENGNIKNSVNFPDVYLSRNANYRLTIVNINQPGMVAKISQQLAQAGHNIVEFINKSQDDMAYTIVDTHTAINDELLSRLSKIKGILRVRLLPMKAL